MIRLKTILFGLLCTTGLQSATAQERTPEKHHRVVMQVTQADSLTQLAVIGQVRNILKALPGAEINIVCHADALDLLVEGRSKVGAHIAELSNANIRFVACENTMTRRRITASQLLPNVKTVPSGLAEIVLKQEDGWSYVKGGH